MLTNAHDRPRIGVPFRTAAEENAGEAKRHKITNYYRAVEEAGGEVVPVSLHLSAGERKRLAESLDGVVLPGSPADVDPARYGASRHAASHEADKQREDTDYALLDDAFASGKPVLAICYGTQLLNVCLGGSLYQDIAGELHSPIEHSKDGLPSGAPDPVHPARIESGGEIAQLAAACGFQSAGGRFEAQVNTSHHQAIRDPGRGLRVAAYAPDGVIEAVEHEPHKHWVIGVQWHPERMAADALSRALFRALILATRAATARR
jgi:putative glutamine amidotransferase